MFTYDTIQNVYWVDTTKEIAIDMEYVQQKTAIAIAYDALTVAYISDGVNWKNLATSANVPYFTLSTTIGENSTLTVVDANGRALFSGDRIEPGAVLTITADDATGYTLSTFTVNTVDKTSGNPDEHTVAADVAIVTAATINTYKVQITQGANTAVEVLDAEETEYEYEHDDDVDYGTVLTISALPGTGYDLTTFTVNTEDVTSPHEHTVGLANVVIVTAATEE